jgi:23S rRNA pseudouridine2605 synthase
MAEERLQKILSQAGVTSRRKAEQLILEGRVRVNGKVVVELGTKADIATDHIKVDNKLLRPPRSLVYIALNKPDEYVTTVSDPEGRRTVMDLIKGVKERVYPVGRLDYHSEGLILLTNDGDFANKISAPNTKVNKTYVVKVNGMLTPDQEENFRTGVPLYGKRTAPCTLKLLKKADNAWYEVQLIEGRQNQIRIMFRYFGLLVEKLKRVRIAFLPLDVKPGKFRHLDPKEIARFRKMLKLEDPKPKDDDDDTGFIQ